MIEASQHQDKILQAIVPWAALSFFGMQRANKYEKKKSTEGVNSIF